MAAKKEVAQVEEGGVPAAYDYGEYEGAGFENHTRDDYAIPFINLLQALSPQVEAMDNAKAGMIFNSVTEELFKGTEGIVFVPCYTSHVFVAWRPKEAGGGIVAVYPVDDPIVIKAKQEHDFGKEKDEDGNDLVETYYVYGILVKEEGLTEEAVMAFTSTKIKKYKGWMTKARKIQIPLPNGRKVTPPLFAHRYRVKTTKQKNNHGEFYNWDIGFDGANAAECRLATDDVIFQEASALAKMVSEGAVKADYNSQAATGDHGGEAASEEAPF